MDFSGAQFDLYHRGTDFSYHRCSLPFDLVLRRDHLGPGEIRRAMAAASGGQGADQLVLKGFQHDLPLMAGEDAVLKLLWRCYFQAFRKEIRRDWKHGNVTAVVPTTWVPQIGAALGSSFSEIFGSDPNICATAAAAPFCALTAIKAKLASWLVSQRQGF